MNVRTARPPSLVGRGARAPAHSPTTVILAAMLNSETSGDGRRSSASSTSEPPVARRTSTHRVVIERGSIGLLVALREVWDYRELLYFLVWRDIKVRYKQTALGASWAILQPFMLMVVFTLFIGNLGGLAAKTHGIPYPIFLYAGLVPWTFFSQSLNAASQSVVGDKELVSKVYFPRMILPIAVAASFLVDLALSMVVLAGMMVYYGITPTSGVVFLPAFIVLAYATSLALSTWLAALNVRYRDVRYLVPSLLQLWMFLSPVVYPSGLVPPRFRFLYAFNPMAGVCEGFRWALLGQATTVGAYSAVSVAVVALLLAGGVRYFRRVERTFADVV